MKKYKRIALFVLFTLLAAAFSASADETTQPEPEKYNLTQVVALSRHSLRSPLSGPGSTMEKMTPHKWLEWSAPAGDLSLRGAALEGGMGQYFADRLIKAGLFVPNEIPTEGQVRFYANSVQRTIATARYFAAGFLPMADIKVEHKNEIGHPDDVFTTTVGFMSDKFLAHGLAEMAAYGGEKGKAGISDKVRPALALIQDVIDLPHSKLAAEKNITSFDADDIKLRLGKDRAPGLDGGPKFAYSAADGLLLQYYETTDARGAFGRELSFDQWKTIAGLIDHCLSTFYHARDLAVNCANRMLVTLRDELLTKGRKFTFLSAHDSITIATLFALDVEPWELEGSVEQLVPMGSKFVIEKFRGADGNAYARLSLVYQTADQLRGLIPTGPANPPQVKPLKLRGLTQNEDGFYRYEDVLSRFDESLEIYKNLK